MTSMQLTAFANLQMTGDQIRRKVNLYLWGGGQNFECVWQGMAVAVSHLGKFRPEEKWVRGNTKNHDLIKKHPESVFLR